MTTLTTMKARIASELRRSNLTSQIAAAITTAIEAYQDERFYANESRSNTFTTVTDQEFYDSDDASWIASLTKIDYVFLEEISTTNSWELTAMQPREAEDLAMNSNFSGQPIRYAWYDEQFRLYPIPPSASWNVRVGGVFTGAAPASDDEAGNFWMVKGERLIRSRAKFELYRHVLFDENRAATMADSVEEALTQLRFTTTRRTKTGGGRVTPMNF